MNSTDRPTSAISIRSALRDPRAHYLIGEAAGKGVVFAALILIARALGASEFGWVSVYITAASLLSLAVAGGLPNAILRFHFSESSFAAVLGTAAAAMAGTFAIAGGLVALAAIWLGPWLGIPVGLLWVAIPGGMAISLRNAWLSSLRARRRSREHAASQIAEATLFVLAIGVLLATVMRGLDYRFVVAAYSGATAAIALAGLARWTSDPGMRVDPALLAPLFGFATPMIAHGFAMTGLATADQIILNQLAGPAATGIYAFAYRFGMSMVILSTAFSAAWIPDFLELARDPGGLPIIRARATRYVNGMIAAAVALMLVLPPIAAAVGGPAFAEAPRLIPVVIYAYLWFVLYTLAFAHALHGGRSAAIAAATVVALVVNLGLNYLLIPRLGLMGAALASVAGYAALFAAQWMTHRGEITGMPFGTWTMRVGLAGAVAAGLSWWFA